MNDDFLRSILETHSPGGVPWPCIVAGAVVQDTRVNIILRQLKSYIEMSNNRLFVSPLFSKTLPGVANIDSFR